MDDSDFRFETLANLVEDAVFVVDSANIVRFANTAALLRLENPVGRALDFAQKSTVSLTGPSGIPSRFTITRADTSWAGAPATILTLRPQAPLISEVGPLVDEALAVMRGRFLSHVSHELRTPLNSITGFAELLALEPHGPLGADPATAARYRGYAEDIRWSGVRMTALVADLLDLAAVEAGDLQLEESRFELGPLLAEVLHEAPATARRSVVPTLGRIDPMVVAGDRGRLKRALIHLVVNGLSSGGGEVSLTAKASRDGRLKIGVSDSGPGFSPEAMARAGEAFARARTVDRADPDAGLGVGLAVARHMFELHGGGIGVASRRGRGATVTCVLPQSRVVRAAPSPNRH